MSPSVKKLKAKGKSKEIHEQCHKSTFFLFFFALMRKNMNENNLHAIKQNHDKTPGSQSR
jgi:hypothetical protein